MISKKYRYFIEDLENLIKLIKLIFFLPAKKLKRYISISATTTKLAAPHPLPLLFRRV